MSDNTVIMECEDPGSYTFILGEVPPGVDCRVLHSHTPIDLVVEGLHPLLGGDQCVGQLRWSLLSLASGESGDQTR